MHDIIYYMYIINIILFYIYIKHILYVLLYVYTSYNVSNINHTYIWNKIVCEQHTGKEDVYQVMSSTSRVVSDLKTIIINFNIILFYSHHISPL